MSTLPGVVIVESFESEIEPDNFALVIELSAILAVDIELSAMSAVAIVPSAILEESTALFTILLFVIALFAMSAESIVPSKITVVSTDPTPPDPPKSSDPQIHAVPFHFKTCPAELGAPVGRG